MKMNSYWETVGVHLLPWGMLAGPVCFRWVEAIPLLWLMCVGPLVTGAESFWYHRKQLLREEALRALSGHDDER